MLPSPNGSSISFDLADSGMTWSARPRNRTAVARWLAPRIEAGSCLAVVAAGERWPDGSLRPGVEDLWGAGAVLAALVNLGVSGLSPEAEQAAAAFTAAAPDLSARMWACASGRELDAIRFGDDVRVAGERDASDVVPVLDGEAFDPGERPQGDRADEDGLRGEVVPHPATSAEWPNLARISTPH